MLKKILPLLGLCLSVIVVAGPLEDGFENPPRSAGIRCWWWWLNSNVTRDAITKDLEAMHDKQFSGALIFDAGGAEQRGNRQVPAGPTFASKAWVDLFEHAVHEADRLGLELGLCIQSGWNLGGPTVTPAMAAKRLTWSEIEIEGPLAASKVLPQPPMRDGFYRDIAVLAFPIKDRPGAADVTVAESSSQPGYPGKQAIDGQAETMWVSGGTEPGRGPTADKPEWLTLTFDQPVEAAGITIIGRPGYGPRQGRLEVLNEADDYQTVHAFRIADGQDYEQTFDAVTGKQFRLAVTASYDPVHPTEPRNVQITELALLDAEGRNYFARPARRPIRDLDHKASFHELGWSAPDSRFLLDHEPPVEGEADAAVTDILNLTDKLSDSGRLTWQVPAGKWCVLRFGYTCNDSHVSTHSEGWSGRVVDYLSQDAITQYLDEVVKPLLDGIGEHAGTTLKYLQTDSWECGGMNWTDRYPQEFQQRRGYDPVPWLPVIAGKIIDDRAACTRFLADFRKTISDCIAENHYGTFADFAHRRKMGIQPESGGPHAGPFDAMKNLGRNDIAMAEFWSPSPHRATPRDRFFVKQAASVAHIYGKRLVGAEAFTTIGPHWNDVLWSQTRPSFNHEACSGLNLVYLHTFTCSPKAMGLPGQEYFAGTHFNPQVTWWEYADGPIDYFRRCQYLFQQADYTADVLYYYGDHIPNVARLKEDDPAQVLPAYDYDLTNEEILLQLTVDDGRLVTPGGTRYRLLVLPDHKVLSPAALEKVAALLKQGACVAGPKPERLVSLVGGPAAQQRFAQLAEQLWGPSPPKTGSRKIGTGTLFWGLPGRDVLAAMDVAPDVTFAGTQAGVYDWIHYTLDGRDVYFVINLTGDTQDTTASFRISGKQPQLWDPLDGSVQDAIAFTAADGRTAIPLRLHPYDGLFVVFQNRPARPAAGIVNYKDYDPVATLTGPWQVTFDTAWGGPGTVTFATLTDWVDHIDRGIKFYSGKAVYDTTFAMGAVTPGRRYLLDLGDVQDVGICKVMLNGRDLGVVWTRPFRADITGALQPGDNRLTVSVINSWRNRLIGDRSLPESERLTSTNITVRRDWPLEASGLLGPVQVLVEAAP